MKAYALRQERVAKLLHSSASAPLPQNVFATGQYALHQPLGSWMGSSSGGSGLAHNSISSVDNNALMLAVQAGASIASHTALQVLEQANVTNVATLNQVHNIVGALTTSKRSRSIAPAPGAYAYITGTDPSPLTTTVNPVASNDQAKLQRLYAKRERDSLYKAEKRKRKKEESLNDKNSNEDCVSGDLKSTEIDIDE
jgi:hypothetical protein